MAVDIGGLVAIIIFYVIILIVGFWAARKTGFKTKNLETEDTMLANRSIGYVVGIFTATATWVGGGYINGSAEAVVGQGLVWCQAPIGAIGVFVGGLFFCDKMRTSGFTTMLDPFLWKFGSLMNCLLYLPALTGDVFWSGAILSALGATLQVILGLDMDMAIIISALISVLYTLVGGLYSVAYTDVIQLILIFIGLWLCIPFAMTHDAVSDISVNATDNWIGEVTRAEAGLYIDLSLLLIFGSIPWQVYWQRVLGAKSVRVSQVMSYIGAIAIIIMVIPSVLIGAVASSTDWSVTGYGKSEIVKDDVPLALPLVLKHLCPPAVRYIGLGAVSAAVMSSTDSAYLSSSSMFSKNIFNVLYGLVKGEKPSETAQVWVMRVVQVLIGVLSCVFAIQVKSVYYLFLLTADFVYVLIFPQLVCVMYLKKVNSYGSFTGFILGLLFRILGGDTQLKIGAAIKFPGYVEKENMQFFPFRTLAMLISFVTIMVVSYLTDYIFTSGLLSLKYDFYRCFKDLDKKNEYTKDQPTHIKQRMESYRSTQAPAQKQGLDKKNEYTLNSDTKDQPTQMKQRVESYRWTRTQTTQV